MDIFSVILAGGGGTRFWPLSRQSMPKQLLNLSGRDVMINETLRRCEGVIPFENTYIVTNQTQLDPMRKLLTDGVPRENILVEPMPRNTAPCVLYAALRICREFGDCVLCVFPSDHYIEEEERFRAVLRNAAEAAQTQDTILTIGIETRYPSTGYGYIKKAGNPDRFSAYAVERFEEKPDAEKAEAFCKSADYFWNSGMFVFKASVIIEAFKRYLPKYYGRMLPLINHMSPYEEANTLKTVYQALEPISLDYGIMERADNLAVIPGDFGWSDLGSWDALGSVLPPDENDNLIKAEHVCVDTSDCIIYGDKKLIATVGLSNVVIVDSRNAILVCDKEKAQDVRKVVEKLKVQGNYELL
jgi:Mannose-1-phosphate guanylyltransferase